jgi:hypothetical protein
MQALNKSQTCYYMTQKKGFFHISYGLSKVLKLARFDLPNTLDMHKSMVRKL